MSTDTSEQGLEKLICASLTGGVCPPAGKRDPDLALEPAGSYIGTGWTCGLPSDYDREYCVDLYQLSSFLRVTQPAVAEALGVCRG